MTWEDTRVSPLEAATTQTHLRKGHSLARHQSPSHLALGLPTLQNSGSVWRQSYIAQAGSELKSVSRDDPDLLILPFLPAPCFDYRCVPLLILPP